MQAGKNESCHRIANGCILSPFTTPNPAWSPSNPGSKPSHQESASMANLNKVMLIGRLTRDPEVRSFANGGKVAAFGFAVNNRKKNSQTGDWEDDPVFLDCEAFNRSETFKLADRIEQTLHKGQQIFIEGHLKLDQWNDKTSGEKRSKLKIVVENCQYLEPKGDGGSGGGS